MDPNRWSKSKILSMTGHSGLEVNVNTDRKMLCDIYLGLMC